MSSKKERETFMHSQPFEKGARFFHGRRVFVLLVALWVLTLAGIQAIPLETHEAFVLATAQEMQTGGDWVLPRFNSELRLTKPPLNYWATLLVSAIDPSRDDIQIYHGRLVSLFAVLLMVLLTAKAGGKLYGKETGVLAAVMLLCSSGMLQLSHNAKPDVLYAALCTLQLFAWVEAWKADTPSRQRGCALLGWVAVGLATLTKGPQVPAVFLLGLLVFLLSGPDRRRVFQILRPVSGLIVASLLVLPWWLLLQQRLRALGVDVADSQLSGSLLHNLASWKELLGVYYLWQTLVQMLPVNLLLILILPQFIKKDRPVMQPATRLLACVSIALLILFTLGGHYRKHYLLPLLPVYSVFLANSARFLRFQGVDGILKKGLWAVAAVGAAVCAGFMVWRGEYGVLGLYVGVGLLVARLLKLELAGSFREQPVFIRQLLVMTAALTVLGAGFNAYLPTALWQEKEQDFKRSIGKRLSENDRLVCWKTSVNILPYFVRQPVRAFTEEDKLLAYVKETQSSHPVFALMSAGEMPSFNAFFKTRTRQTFINKKKPTKSLAFVEILGLQVPPPAHKQE